MLRELEAQGNVNVLAGSVAESSKLDIRDEPGFISCGLDRRSFLRCALTAGAALGVCELSPHAAAMPAMPSWSSSEKQDDTQFTVEAKFYQKLENKKIKCKLCPRECTVGDRERGY